ncbi:hypothetical protein [Niabella ginsengisoli]|uniref:hypothetical protein n=1 Tax=Niabella ginsengisoli TaxID=522298 RepID=UPI00293EE84B|nr:hypothetical protein [Niabella ginsengisoli]
MIVASQTNDTPAKKKKFYQVLYIQVLIAIIIGSLLGYFYPSLGERMKPLVMDLLPS